MRVQRNQWDPKSYRFQSYTDAVIEEEVSALRQLDRHSSLGSRAMMVFEGEDRPALMMEGVTISLHQSAKEPMIQGYVEDDRERGTLHRELWIVLDD